MQNGLFIPNISKEDFLNEVATTVKKATKDAFKKLDNDKLFTQDEACTFLNTSKSTLVRWEKLGKITTVRIGGRVYYKKSDLLNR